MVRIYFLICCLLITLSCGRQKKAIYKENQASSYQPSIQTIRPVCSVFHLSDSISQLLIKINLSQLLFNQANAENRLQSKVQFKYLISDITDDAQNDKITDSLTTERVFYYAKGKDLIVLSVNFRARYGRKYTMMVEVTDQLRKAGQKNYLVVDKLTGYSQQNFRVITKSDNMPLFDNYIPGNDSFKIVLNRKADKLFVKYVKDDTPLPPPPYSKQTEPAFNFYGDSSWVLPYTIGKFYNFSKPGLYFIQTDTSQSQGLFLASYNKYFPYVSDIKAMVPSLEYLTTSEEFKILQKIGDPKLAVDDFWLKFSGNVEVGKEMIRIYYNRMYLANLYFSSYKQGWKTDRGMIYMIFGPPSYIRKTASSETWEYYIRSVGQNLTLDFQRFPNPYSYNHFILSRSDYFTPYWRAAISSWRNGKVFNLEE